VRDHGLIPFSYQSISESKKNIQPSFSRTITQTDRYLNPILAICSGLDDDNLLLQVWTALKNDFINRASGR
jgi:hypothetical protein